MCTSSWLKFIVFLFFTPKLLVAENALLEKEKAWSKWFVETDEFADIRKGVVRQTRRWVKNPGLIQVSETWFEHSTIRMRITTENSNLLETVDSYNGEDRLAFECMKDAQRIEADYKTMPYTVFLKSFARFLKDSPTQIIQILNLYVYAPL